MWIVVLTLLSPAGGPPRDHRRWRQAGGQGGPGGQRGGLDDLGQRLGRGHDLRADAHRQSSGEALTPL